MAWKSKQAAVCGAYGGGDGGVVGVERVGVGADADGADGNAGGAGRAAGLRDNNESYQSGPADENGSRVRRADGSGCARRSPRRCWARGPLAWLLRVAWRTLPIWQFSEQNVNGGLPVVETSHAPVTAVVPAGAMGQVVPEHAGRQHSWVESGK